MTLSTEFLNIVSISQPGTQMVLLEIQVYHAPCKLSHVEMYTGQSLMAHFPEILIDNQNTLQF